MNRREVVVQGSPSVDYMRWARRTMVLLKTATRTVEKERLQERYDRYAAHLTSAQKRSMFIR